MARFLRRLGEIYRAARHAWRMKHDPDYIEAQGEPLRAKRLRKQQLEEWREMQW